MSKHETPALRRPKWSYGRRNTCNAAGSQRSASLTIMYLIGAAVSQLEVFLSSGSGNFFDALSLFFLKTNDAITRAREHLHVRFDMAEVNA